MDDGVFGKLEAVFLEVDLLELEGGGKREGGESGEVWREMGLLLVVGVVLGVIGVIVMVRGGLLLGEAVVELLVVRIVQGHNRVSSCWVRLVEELRVLELGLVLNLRGELLVEELLLLLLIWV